MDKLQHFIICFALALWRWDYSIVMALTIEATQAEYGGNPPWGKAFWRWMGSHDTTGDLVADGLGVVAGVYVRSLLFNN